MEGIDAGYFATYIGCAPEKGKTALKGMRKELDRLATDLIGPEEFERSQKYLIGRHDIDLQKNSSVSSGILFNEIYGLGTDEIFNYAEKINSVTPEQVRQVAQDLFSQKSVAVAVGRENPF